MDYNILLIVAFAVAVSGFFGLILFKDKVKKPLYIIGLILCGLIFNAVCVFYCLVFLLIL